LVYNNGNDKIHTKSGRICTRVNVMLDKSYKYINNLSA